MKKLELEEIKLIQLNILKSFKDFCGEHNIQFFLSNGTLLGAVKYKGFIPWDDDIDVFVPRKDYLKLIKEYPQNDKLHLLCMERDNHYVFPFAKLSDTSTIIQGQTILHDYACGVHIDIFPLDYWSDDVKISRKLAKKINSNIKKLSFSIAAFSKGHTLIRTFVKNLLIAYTRAQGAQYYKKKLNSIIRESLALSGTQYSGCVVWPVYGKREIIDSTVFVNIVYLEFEGENFPAPIGYDIYLRSLYGDYEKDPPLEMQKSHHKYTAYRI